MTDFDFDLTTLNDRGKTARSILGGLGWVALAVLLIVTGVHAVTIVAEHSAGGGGLLYAIRISAPILVEVFAGLVAAGFAVDLWRGGQRLTGVIIEVVWAAFAGLNLLAAFTSDGGGPLPPWLAAWVDYGLPVAGLTVGVLFYALVRQNPESLRRLNTIAANERLAEVRFAAGLQANLSPAMLEIEAQRAWLAAIDRLRRQGYSQDQIAHMLRGTPALQSPQAQPTLPQPFDYLTPPLDRPHVRIVTGRDDMADPDQLEPLPVAGGAGGGQFRQIGTTPAASPHPGVNHKAG